MKVKWVEDNVEGSPLIAYGKISNIGTQYFITWSDQDDGPYPLEAISIVFEDGESIGAKIYIEEL